MTQPNEAAPRVLALPDGARVLRGSLPIDGVKVIPVAKARWGFGGGGGSRDAGGEGSGGGGGVWVSPVGYIEMKDGDSRFRPIQGPAAKTAVLVDPFG